MSSSRSKRSGKSGRKRAGTDVDKSATKILRTDSGASSSSASSIGDAFIGNDARRDLRSSRSGKAAVTFPADGNGNPASPVRRPPRTTASASPNKTAHDYKENDTVANKLFDMLSKRIGVMNENMRKPEEIAKVNAVGKAVFKVTGCKLETIMCGRRDVHIDGYIVSTPRHPAHVRAIAGRRSS